MFLSISAESYLAVPIAVFLVIVATSGLLFLVQFSFSQSQAYCTAPLEIATIIDMANFSHQDYSSERRKTLLAQVSVEDNERMSYLLGEILKSADDLRKELSKISLLSDEGKQVRKEELGFSARLMWLVKRSNFIERVRKLEQSRTRFFLDYFELLAAKVSTDSSSPATRIVGVDASSQSPLLSQHNASVSPATIQTITPPNTKTLQLTQPTTSVTPADVVSVQSHGWNNVVAELQRSPLMHKRHNVIERHAARLPA